jgi:hypothetical protein
MDGAIYRLLEEFMAYAISLTTTTPGDAVWAPPDCAAVLARADEPLVLDCRESKKELFTRLCDSPVLLDGATMVN